MEPQQNKVESVITPLRKVTPLSKYLAALLFISLPFVGAWIGYSLALQEVGEPLCTIPQVPNSTVEETVEQENSNETALNPESVTQEEIDSLDPKMIIDPQTAGVGDTYGNFAIKSILYNPEFESVSIEFIGSAVVSGTISQVGILGPGINLDSASTARMPAVLLQGEAKRLTFLEMSGPLVESLPEEAIMYRSEENPPYSITAEVKNYIYHYQPKEIAPIAEVVRIIEIKKNF